MTPERSPKKKHRQDLIVTKDQFRAIQKLNMDLCAADTDSFLFKQMDYRFACAVNSIINGVTAIGPMRGDFRLVVNP